MGAEFDYQRRVAGRIVYTVAGGGVQINADGIRSRDCTLLEAKFVGEDPEESPFILNNHARQNTGRNQFFAQAIDPIQNREFARYSAVLRDPIVPAIGLEVITNQSRSESYWQQWIDRNSVPNPRIVIVP